MKLSNLERAIECSWDKDTSASPNEYSRTTYGNPLGQCAVTALVVQDYLGGKIVNAVAQLPEGETLPNGNTSDSHYWNNINGTDIDLTRNQFPRGTVIPEGQDKKKEFASTREYVLSYEPTRQRYEILKEKVKECLEYMETI